MLFKWQQRQRKVGILKRGSNLATAHSTLARDVLVPWSSLGASTFSMIVSWLTIIGLIVALLRREKSDLKSGPDITTAHSCVVLPPIVSTPIPPDAPTAKVPRRAATGPRAHGLDMSVRHRKGSLTVGFQVR